MTGSEGRPEQLTGGQLNAAIARGIVHLHSHYVGRGPTKAQAFSHDNFLVVMMQDTMTRGERSLASAGRADTVLDVRTQLQRMLEPKIVAEVEALTGCRVRAFLGANHVEPDIEAELFVLDGAPPCTGSGEAADEA
jgi:uncharacterized protein YbcI